MVENPKYILPLRKKHDKRRNRTHISQRTRHPVHQLQPSRGKDHRGGETMVERRRQRALQEPLLPQPQGQPPLSRMLQLRPRPRHPRPGTSAERVAGEQRTTLMRQTLVRITRTYDEVSWAGTWQRITVRTHQRHRQPRTSISRC